MNSKVIKLFNKAESELIYVFNNINKIEELNSNKFLKAFRECNVT